MAPYIGPPQVQYSNLEGYVSVTTLKELEKARLRHQQLSTLNSSAVGRR